MVDPNRLTLHRAVPVAEFRRMALLRTLDVIRAFHRRLETRTKRFATRESVALIQYDTLDEIVEAVKEEAKALSSEAGRETVFPDQTTRLSDGKRTRIDEVSYQVVEAEFAGPRRVIMDLTHRERGGLLLLQAFHDLLRVEARFSGTDVEVQGDLSRLTADDTHVYFFVTDKGLRGAESTPEEDEAWRETGEAAQFVVSVGRLLQQVRRDGRRPNAAESAVAQAAYEVLGRGTAVASPYQSLGVPGFRKLQTLLFITDPGPGHLQVTCHMGKLLEGRGAVVHIEHIDRDETKDKNPQIIEAYRLPAPFNAAKVRLHIGPDAPCSAFIGRPIFENRKPDEEPAKPEDLARPKPEPKELTPEEKEAAFQAEAEATALRLSKVDIPALRYQYKLDRLKSAHMTASSCTAMFLNGVAECKVAIERMTASDAVDFMKAVAGNVFRDRHRQYLSAAFNIFTPLYDDFRKPDPPRWVKDPEEICELGIALAVAGGFDKVTWDGAKRGQFPSRSILDRGEKPNPSHKFWVEIVHKAHLQGLLTYVSAGLEPKHMPRAVYAGIDGLGIGVKLHDYDEESGRTGDFNPTIMMAVLETARLAQETTLGRAAKMLARLARLKFESVLSDSSPEEQARLDLLACLGRFEPLSESVEKDPIKLIHLLLEQGEKSDEAQKAGEILKSLEHIKKLRDDRPLESPFHGQVRRIEWAKSLEAAAAASSSAVTKSTPDVTSQVASRGGLESVAFRSVINRRRSQLRGELTQADQLAVDQSVGASDW